MKAPAVLATATLLAAALAAALAARADSPPEPAAADVELPTWEEARAHVAGSPHYGGLVLEPQEGLVPLGPDPHSGLYEFWLPESGAPPPRDPTTGSVRVGPRSGLVLVLVPGGSYLIGAQSSDPDGELYDPLAPADETPNEVVLAPYFVSKFELTQGQWFRLFGTRPSRFDRRSRGGEHHPVEHVTWELCMAEFPRAGLTLPTEAQWEVAARGGTQTPWWTGREAESVGAARENVLDATAAEKAATANWDQHEAWTDGFLLHAPVGTSAPNPFGLHEVVGNVREWCRDRWGSYTLPTRPGDGLRLVPEGSHRVIRGGCFRFCSFPGRSSNRLRMEPHHTGAPLGVRPARLLDGPERPWAPEPTPKKES